MLGDTIAAVSTPRGRGGVAVLRVSGAEAIEICEKIFVARNGRRLSEQTPRMAIRGDIYAVRQGGERTCVDDGLVTVFRAPASFTGEDTVEISCHGGTLLTQTVLTSLLSCGARAAEAGEFTRRAFLGGKIGLSSAEALGNILEAQTHAQLTLAHTGMRGRIEARCNEIYEKLRDILASIYAKIDYPDEDLADMSREEMLSCLRECYAMTDALLRTYKTGHAIAEGISTVICGKPNVGKSSLYNRLLGREAAIVTDVEGTTRDVLTESISLGCVTLRLYDTAGLHETDNPVEQIGIARTRDALDGAELIFAVFDGSRENDAEDIALAKDLQDRKATVVAIVNKSDRRTVSDDFYASNFNHVVHVSAQTGEGMDALSRLVETLFTDDKIDLRGDAVLTNARQHAAAYKAAEALERAMETLVGGYPIELSCADAEEAMTAISELDGRAVSEDIVSQIFSHFCVGK